MLTNRDRQTDQVPRSSWFSRPPNPKDRRIDRFRQLLWFLPAGLVVWVAYDVLMLVIGGRNATYGPGWPQWNYVRWMLAPFDDVPYPAGIAHVILFFLVFPACFMAAYGSMTFTERTYYHETTRSMLVDAFLFCQLPGLVMQMSSYADLHFWWSAPKTIIPTLTIQVFEIGTIVAWFASPLIVYWITMSLVQRSKGRHRLLPDALLPEESDSGQG